MSTKGRSQFCCSSTCQQRSTRSTIRYYSYVYISRTVAMALCCFIGSNHFSTVEDNRLVCVSCGIPQGSVLGSMLMLFRLEEPTCGTVFPTNSLHCSHNFLSVVDLKRVRNGTERKQRKSAYDERNARHIPTSLARRLNRLNRLNRNRSV